MSINTNQFYKEYFFNSHNPLYTYNLKNLSQTNFFLNLRLIFKITTQLVVQTTFSHLKKNTFK